MTRVHQVGPASAGSRPSVPIRSQREKQEPCVGAVKKGYSTSHYEKHEQELFPVPARAAS